MRYTPEHKEKTRKRILQAASGEFKKRGFAATGVDAVMKAADLTHGGFYAHFKNKNELIAASISEAVEQIKAMYVKRLGHLSGVAWLEAWLDMYLSDGHCEHPEAGCPAPPLASEIARADDSAHHVFDEMIDEWADLIASHLPSHMTNRRELALAAIAQVVGAMSIARGVDEKLSSEIRKATRSIAFAMLTQGVSDSTTGEQS